MNGSSSVKITWESRHASKSEAPCTLHAHVLWTWVRQYNHYISLLHTRAAEGLVAELWVAAPVAVWAHPTALESTATVPQVEKHDLCRTPWSQLESTPCCLPCLHNDANTGCAVVPMWWWPEGADKLLEMRLLPACCLRCSKTDSDAWRGYPFDQLPERDQSGDLFLTATCHLQISWFELHTVNCQLSLASWICQPPRRRSSREHQARICCMSILMMSGSLKGGCLGFCQLLPFARLPQLHQTVAKFLALSTSATVGTKRNRGMKDTLALKWHWKNMKRYALWFHFEFNVVPTNLLSLNISASTIRRNRRYLLI